MLPYVEEYNGKHVITNFRQYPELRSTPTTEGGACFGISCAWIHAISHGERENFTDNILTQSGIQKVSHFQSLERIDFYSIVPHLEASMDLSRGLDPIYLHQAVTYRGTGEILSMFTGYILVGLCRYAPKGSLHPMSYGHAVAMYSNGEVYEFFDPNYGSASFTDRKKFVDWFVPYCYACARNEAGHLMCINRVIINHFLKKGGGG